MKAIKIILFLVKGLFVLAGQSSGQQSFFILDEISGRETYLLSMAVDSGQSIDTIRHKIILDLSEAGFFYSRIDSVNHDENMARFYITLGVRSKIDSIMLISENDTSIVVIDEYYHRDVIDGIIQAHLDSAVESGYPFANIEIRSFDFSDDSNVKLVLQQNNGERVRIADIHFLNNHQLTDDYIKKIIRFKPGELYSEEIISGYESVLANNVFIQSAEFLGLHQSEGAYTKIFDIRENRSSSVDLILGYEPGASDGSRVAGNGSLRLNNLISEGSLLRLEFQRLPRSDSRLIFEFDQYWFRDIPLNAGINFNLTQRDSTYQILGGGINADYELTQNIKFGIFGRIGSTRGAGTTSLLTTIDNRVYETGLRAQISELDRLISPRNGYRSDFTASIGIKYLKKIPDGSLLRHSYTQQKYTLNGQAYRNLYRDFVLGYGLHAAHLVADQSFEDDLFILGGTRNLRGYQEDQFRSSSYIWTDVEIRYLLDTYSYFFVFGATGMQRYPVNYLNIDQVHQTENLYSTGLGLSYRIRLGMLKLTYAVGSDDTFTNGKIHFGITNSF